MQELIEARCPKPKCSKTHHVIARNGEIIQTAMCPPSDKHRNWVPMTPGAANVEARRGVFVERKAG